MSDNVPEKQQRLRTRFTTPPPVVASKDSNLAYLKTLQRSAVFAAL